MERLTSWAAILCLGIGAGLLAGCAGPPEAEGDGPPPGRTVADGADESDGSDGGDESDGADESDAPGEAAEGEGDDPAALLQDDGVVGGAGGGAGRDVLDELADELGLQEEAQRELADHYYQQGLAQYRDLQYRDARSSLRQAVQADPNHEEARRLLDQVLFLLGDEEGGTRDVAREMADRTQAEIRLTRMQVERIFAEGLRLMERREFDAAIERFERIQEIIRFFPFHLDVSELENQTAQKIDEARRLREEQAIQRRENRIDAARENARIAEERSDRFQENRLRSMMESARSAYRRMDFDEAERLGRAVLQEDPRHTPARNMVDRAVRARTRRNEIRAIEREVEEMRRTIEGVRQAAIPYQDIFRWPDADTWREIANRYTPPSQIQHEERSLVEQEILNTLENRTISIDLPGIGIQETLTELQNMTGLNIVLSTAARDEIEASGDVPVTLNLSEVRLRNALELILDHVEGLTWKIRHGVVLVTTQTYDESELVLRFYQVSDLTSTLPEFPAPELALDIGAGTDGGGGGGFGGGSVIDFGGEDEEQAGGIEIERLRELMEQAVGDAALDFGSIEPSGGVIVARLPSEAHQRIEDLLEALRRTVGIMVTVEVRFVDIQDNFLEEIGVDWRDARDATGTPFPIYNPTGQPNPQPGQFPAQNSGYIWTGAHQEQQVRSALVNTFTQGTGTSSSNPFNLTSSGGIAAQYNVLMDSFQIEAILEAVKKRQRARLVHAPRVTVFNGQRSHVLAISQEAYIADVEVNQTGVTPVLNPVIGILNSGSILEARPIVSHDRRYVNLEIRPTLAINLTDDQADVANLNLSGGNTQIPIQLPVLSVQTLRTTVTIPDGGTVLLGGLKNFRGEERYSGIPVLGNIPILRQLFERRGWTDMKRSLVVLVKADITIIREEEDRRFSFD